MEHDRTTAWLSSNRNIVLAVLLAIFACAWYFRHDFYVVQNGDRAGFAYMLNRWTGTIYVVTPSSVRQVDGKPAQ